MEDHKPFLQAQVLNALKGYRQADPVAGFNP